MLNNMEFEQQLKAMDDRSLLELVARQQNEMACLCKSHGERIGKLENSDSHTKLAAGIISLIVATGTAVAGWFIKK